MNARRLAHWLRTLADRIDYDGAPKIMSWSFTFEQGEGIRFRQDGKGCPMAYLGSEDYQRAHDEADSETGPQGEFAMKLPGLRVTVDSRMPPGFAALVSGDSLQVVDLSAFTCPRCGKVSHHPEDRRQGYCGACHEWTGEPQH